MAFIVQTVVRAVYLGVVPSDFNARTGMIAAPNIEEGSGHIG